jgi:AcrR family transcriptional regulator
MKSESRRKEIIDAFEKLVNQYGIDKTTMHDVARDLKMSVGLLYTEFSGKDDLIESLLDRIHMTLVNLDKSREFSEMTVEDKLKEVLVKYVEKLSLRVRKSKAVYDFMGGILPTKYLRKKIEAKRHLIEEEFLKKIESILTLGVLENKFKIENVPQIARVIFAAFESYRIPPLILMKEHEALMEDAQKMFEIILNYIKPN